VDVSATRRGPLSRAADVGRLAPIIVMRALERAGTVVCEPIIRVRPRDPSDTIGAIMPALARHGAAVERPSLEERLCTIEAVLQPTGAELRRHCRR
jgi:ribosomal protection tetracycline resistance protein